MPRKQTQYGGEMAGLLCANERTRLRGSALRAKAEPVAPME